MDPSKKPLSTRLNPVYVLLFYFYFSLEIKKLTVIYSPPEAIAQKTNKTSRPSSRGNSGSRKSTKAKESKPKSNRRPKKTLEELDAEMADYFEKKA